MTPVPNACNESGREEDEDLFTVAAMLSCGGRWWGNCGNDNGKEDEAEEDDDISVTIMASGAAAGKMADLRSPQGGRRR